MFFRFLRFLGFRFCSTGNQKKYMPEVSQIALAADTITVVIPLLQYFLSFILHCPLNNFADGVRCVLPLFTKNDATEWDIFLLMQCVKRSLSQAWYSVNHVVLPRGINMLRKFYTSRLAAGLRPGCFFVCINCLPLRYLKIWEGVRYV